MKVVLLQENYTMHRHIYIVLILILATAATTFMSVGCESSPIRMSADEKLMADTLAEKEIKVIGKDYDNWCTNNHNTLVMRWTDSLVKFQIQAIEAKLKQNVPDKKTEMKFPVGK
jgi:hypothetical protein